ncbi:branched-chain amino acid ABC transporter permease [Paracraurococcus lichenis]|uniref:Branched-chain amino acid ABC transporter permease n=1 Tax=Paracraurococcus lichenis TaxID=3064888 RepID=A0ABT9E8Y8_9PROT|nr:branched-chain amino acid ABC transporter permease [Paracraurococcus sp. LOR1-02]MDO9712667.1 branched-chain amino acid ABC transporter permease [Paracraurococcus sp. LOR1-02]
MLLQQAVNGLTLGAVYTLVALAFSLVMGVLGVLNLAVAELFMLGGYIGLSLVLADWPLPVAIAAAAAGCGALAVAVERIAYRPLRRGPPILPLLSTLGCSAVLQTAAVNLWGSDPLQLPPDLLDGRVALGGASIGVAQIFILAATVLLVAGLAWLVQRSRFGLGLRAIAENRDVARLLGVPADRATSLAFGLSGGLAGIAGVLIGLHYAALTPYVGVETGLKAIAVMVIGGATRVWGVLLAGPLVGLVEVFSVVEGGAGFRDVAVYGLMILILLLRPQGLLGGRAAVAQRV